MITPKLNSKLFHETINAQNQHKIMLLILKIIYRFHSQNCDSFARNLNEKPLTCARPPISEKPRRDSEVAARAFLTSQSWSFIASSNRAVFAAAHTTSSVHCCQGTKKNGPALYYSSSAYYTTRWISPSVVYQCQPRKCPRRRRSSRRPAIPRTGRSTWSRRASPASRNCPDCVSTIFRSIGVGENWYFLIWKKLVFWFGCKQRADDGSCCQVHPRCVRWLWALFRPNVF